MTIPDETAISEPQHNLPAPLALVVGLGASAGGIKALGQFFAHAPPDAPIAYVVILHLSPDHESRLAEVLQQSTRLRVQQIHDTTPLESNHVYVIPPNRTLRAADGMLLLSEPSRVDERRAPIDIFFRTLAEAYGDQAAAVVLSGTGPDGSNGLKRVKEYGGLTIAQSPEESEHADMPQAAIATGLVDYVLPVAEMPGRIVAYVDRVSRPASPRPPVRQDEDTLRQIMGSVRARTGHDFSDYKLATVRRRVDRRMSLHDIDGLAEYAEFVRHEPDEATALMRELLISVTNFFRGPEAFAFLEQSVIPRLFDGKTSTDPVRVWSAGCATGEEAYSLAMLLAEHSGGLTTSPAFQIFATDLDEAAIAVARQGQYSQADVTDISPERLRRFFQRDIAGYRIRRELREIVLFAHHNVTRDPPFSRLDLITCRNLLIYLNRASQERLLETFHFALGPDGYLFLGTSESIEEGSSLFAVTDKSAHVYQVRPGRARIKTPVDHVTPVAVPSAFTRDHRPQDRIAPGDLHLRLLEQFAPPSLVISDDNVLLHASERASEFLQLAGGEPTRDVFKLIRPELRADLRIALHNAAQTRTRVDVRGARVARATGDAVITITVRPVLRDGTTRGYFLVLFGEEHAPKDAPGTPLATRTERESEQLQEELTRIKSDLRSALEDAETQVEEAKAANEELQAMNEELRSSAKELETSKEELQSTNEELATVNQELKIKIEELALSNNDFRNLINSTDIGAVFLDRSLHVKLSTPRAREVFNLLGSDAGRLLSDITHRLTYPALHEDVRHVMLDLQTIEREVPSTDGRWFLVRIVPYRTSDDRIEGIALTFQDTTTRRQAEARVRASEERLRAVFDSALDYAIFTVNNEGRIDSWNPGAERIFGYRPDEIIGRDSGVLFTPEDRAQKIPEQELATAREKGRALDERWHLRRDGSRLYCSGVTTRIGEGAVLGFTKIARDLTLQQQAEIDLQHAHDALEDRVTERTAALQAEVTQRAGAQEHVMTLLRRLVTAQEDERARIARDLHDQFGQQLTALRLALERHRETLAGGTGADVHLDRALNLARQADDAVDFLAWELRPAALDDLGLVAAMPRFLDEWSSYHGVPAKFQTTGAITGRLSLEAEITFYRVAQEALNNVIKHADATRVDVVIEGHDDAVMLIVEDDGVGFELAADGKLTGIGLIGMRERAALIGGTLQVESAAGKGTTVYLRCPIVESTPEG
jgi:two-component system CheB/CheR fusion protein